MQALEPNACPALVTQGATNLARSFVRRYIETLERPSQHHASSGTQTMSLQCNSRRHLLHNSSKPATHKVKGSTCQHVQGIKRSFVCRRYIETLERPSQPHASSGTRSCRSVSQCSLQRDPEGGPANPMQAPGPNPCLLFRSWFVTLRPLRGPANTIASFVRSFVRRRYIEARNGPSPPHVSPGTQTMSLQSNLWRHLLHKSSKPATHKVRDTTSNMYKA
jgi:hypothetical protein